MSDRTSLLQSRLPLSNNPRGVFKKFSPREKGGDLVYVLGRSGRKAEAKHELEKLHRVNQRRPVDPAAIAIAHVGMGDNEQALAWLDKAYVQRSNLMTTLKVDPIWDPLRGDPRFQTLLRKVGLAQ
jgi:hypothetical protein